MDPIHHLNGYYAFTPRAEISTYSVFMMGPEDVDALSNVKITASASMQQGRPVPNGTYSEYMGTTMERTTCATCFSGNSWCAGHHGSYSLDTPVPSPLFMAFITRWLKIICWSCGSLICKKIPSPKTPINKLMDFYMRYSKLIKECPICGEPTYTVKTRKPVYPLAFVKAPVKSSSDKGSKKSGSYNNSFDDYEPLSYDEILSIFKKVTQETVLKVGMPAKSHPHKLMITNLLIVANTVRPEIKSPDKKMRSSDITYVYKIIVEQDKKARGSTVRDAIDDQKYLLALAVSTLIKGSDSKKEEKVQLFSNTSKEIIGLGNRLAGKNGQLRQNLLGKRTHRATRAVITGDGYIPVGTVGMPIVTAQSIQIYEEVRAYNYSEMCKTLNNGTARYPGCSMIIRKDTGKICGIDGLPQGYKLVHGDILLRDIIDGDYINYNRQPTLSFSSIAGYKVTVLREGNTLRMNPASCKWHNADFDGDCMIGIITQDIMPCLEIKYMSNARNFVVSYQTGSPPLGAFQDSLAGMSMMSSVRNPPIIRSKAMQFFANIDKLGPQNPFANWDFSKPYYDTRELISKVLPAINVSSPTKFYNPKFDPYIKYEKEDIRVEIVNGELVKGVLDADIIGQEAKGGIIHVTHNEYGPGAVLDLLQAFDFLASAQHMWNGYSVSAKDITLSDNAKEQIVESIAKTFAQANMVTEKLYSHQLRPPTGITMRDFYYEQQTNVFNSGDEFLYPPLGDVGSDIYQNGLLWLMASGSKGKLATNFTALTARIGLQDLGGSIIPADVGIGRTSPYFCNWDPDPQSIGYVAQSFYDGIDGLVYVYCAQETRNGLITQALSTALAGAANRNAIKNFENIVLNPVRQCVKATNVIQPLYGGTGFDPRCMETVVFPTILCSDEKFIHDFKAEFNHIDPIFRNEAVESALTEEFEQLKRDRDTFRRTFLTIESENVIKLIRFSDKRDINVNVPRVIQNVLNKSDVNDSVSINPIEAIRMINGLCDSLKYMYVNQRYEEQKRFVPSYYHTATQCTAIAIRSYLCIREILRKRISIEQLEIIIQQIRLTYKKSLMDYGMAVGILAAQCLSEPLTQFVLNAKHRSGAGGGTKTSAIVRVNEILKAVDTNTMKNPTMRIFVDPAIEKNEDAVRTIANHIEMVTVDNIISEVQIFFEKIGAAVHPRFIHENKWVNDFRMFHSSTKPPNVEKYCIRLQIDREKLVLKSLTLRAVITAIQKGFPNLYQVYTAENENPIVIRLYPFNVQIKKQSTKTIEDIVFELMRNIRSHIIRGIPDIIGTRVVSVLRTEIDQKTGEILPDLTRIFAIDTDGSNLEEVFNHPQVDTTRTQTDSILEMAKMFGIQCARTKITSELRSLIPTTLMMHLTIYADEMTSTGVVTSIERSGTAKRDKTNITQRMAFGAPLQVLTEAAINNYTEEIHGVSGPLAMGTVPKIGTLYADTIINEEFIEQFSKRAMNDLDDL